MAEGPGFAKALLGLARRSSSDGGKPGDDNWPGDHNRM